MSPVQTHGLAARTLFFPSPQFRRIVSENYISNTSLLPCTKHHQKMRFRTVWLPGVAWRTPPSRLNLLPPLKNHCRAIFAALQRNPNGAAPSRQPWPPALPARTAGRLLLLSRPASLLLPPSKNATKNACPLLLGQAFAAPSRQPWPPALPARGSRAAPAPEPSGVAPPIPSFQKRNKERLSPSPGTGVRRSPAAALSAGTAGPHSRAAPAPEPSGVAPPYPSLPKTQQRTPVPFSWDRRSRSPAAALAAGTAGPRQLCQPALPASPTYSSSVMSWLRICVAAVTPT